MNRILQCARAATVVVAAAALAGCDVDVTHPGTISAGVIDPVNDARTLSLSAQSMFYQVFQGVALTGGYFSEEVYVGAIRGETNQIGRREFNNVNLDVNGTVFRPLSLSIASNVNVIEALKSSPTATTDINTARAAMNAGFSLELMAEMMCEGVVNDGPALSDTQLLDSAITYFTQAIAIASQAATGGGAEKDKILNASYVGLARAYLQKGDNDNASTTAALVPPSFEYDVVTVDDASNRSLGNNYYSLTLSRIPVVPDSMRDLNDARILWADAGRAAQDAGIHMYNQLKYTNWDSPVRIASGLEAQYIIAEAELKKGNPGAANALIIARSDPSVAGASAAPLRGTTTLAKLMDLRTRDFWMEGKKMGDMRRNPGSVPSLHAAGTPFYKANGTSFGTTECFPIPQEEVNANPNLS